MTTAYTRISFNRADLFEVCKFGLMPKRIGDLWCEGFVPSDRIQSLKAEVNIREL